MTDAAMRTSGENHVGYLNPENSVRLGGLPVDWALNHLDMCVNVLLEQYLRGPMALDKARWWNWSDTPAFQAGHCGFESRSGFSLNKA